MRYVIILLNQIRIQLCLIQKCATAAFFQMQHLHPTSSKTLKLLELIGNIGTHICGWRPKVVAKFDIQRTVNRDIFL